MAEASHLEALYQDAQSALKARDYDKASGLLRQILVEDENYKDTARVLAQMVRLSRRRWYNDSRLYAMFGIAAVIFLVMWLAPRLRNIYAAPVPLANTATPFTIIPPTLTAAITAAPTLPPTSTTIPLAWKRISMGQDFARDTITGVAVDKNDPDVIYVGMMNAGIYKSIDGGLSWSPKYQGVANTHVESLTIDPKNTKILYAGTMGGIFKTKNSGENWEKIGDGYRLLMDPKNSSHLYADTGGGISESTDQGATWENHQSSCPQLSSWAINPQDGMILFGSDTGEHSSCPIGLYKSSNGGRTWTFLGLSGHTIRSLAAGEDEQGNTVIYAGGDNEYVSKDGGKSWNDQHTSVYCSFLPVEPGSPNTVYCASGRSDLVILAAGKSYRAISINGPSNKNMKVNAVHADTYQGTQRLIAGGQGLYISTDNGKSWSDRSGGLGAARLELKIDPANNERMYLASYLGTDESGCALFRSDDSGKNWKQIMQAAQPSWCGPVFDPTNILYLLKEGNLERSTDGGDTWISSLLPSEMSYGSISANPYLAGFLFGESHVLFYSTDYGNSWQKAIDNTKGLSWYNNRLYYAKGGNPIYSVDLAFSTDSGKGWNSCGDAGGTAKSDSRLVIDPGNNQHLYLATNGEGIVISDDGCQSWQPSNAGLGNLFVNSVALDPNNPNTIYAGTNGGAYVSYDSGQTWGQINDGLLGSVAIYSIAIDPQSNVYAATPYGIFQLEGR